MDCASKTNNYSELTHDFPPFFKVYKNGIIERYVIQEFAPAGLDHGTGVLSKDVVISSPTSMNIARIFAPKIETPDQKLPLLVHYHGGGFCRASAFDVLTKNFLTSIVTQAKVIAISIEYRLAPEHPLPTAHNDAWMGLQWVAKQRNEVGSDAMLKELNVDFDRVFLAGESAGANIAHYAAVQAGINELAGLRIKGLLIVHPFFGSEEEDEMVKYMYPTCSSQYNDPIMNPGVDPNLGKMSCEKVLVCVAEKDRFRNRGENYFQILATCDWKGKLDFYESGGQDHVFFKFGNMNNETDMLIEKLADFIIED